MNLRNISGYNYESIKETLRKFQERVLHRVNTQIYDVRRSRTSDMSFIPDDQINLKIPNEQENFELFLQNEDLIRQINEQEAQAKLDDEKIRLLRE